MSFIKRVKAVWNQENDFPIFKGDLEDDLTERSNFYEKEIERISESENQRQDLLNEFKRQHQEDLLEFKDDAKEFYKNAESDKKDQFKDWKSNLLKVFVAWFILMSADKITGTNLFAKYIVLIGGIYMTWKSLIDISLLGQRASFARNCIRNANILLDRKFCYLNVGDENFKNNNGLTKFYVSITKSQISQHKGTLKFLAIGILITIFFDVLPFLF